MESQEIIRLLIAEDQDLVRRGITISIAFAGDMTCLGEARNGHEAVKLAAELNPDIVLMDLHMPGKGGVAATREIRLGDPKIQVLVLTTLSDDDAIFEAMLAGAQGYLLKDVDDRDLLEAIRELQRHESTLTAPLARRILEIFQAEGSSPQITPALTLTSEEMRLLSLLAQGRAPAAAAAALGCSEVALKSCSGRIMDKLHAKSDAQYGFRSAGAAP